MKVDLSSYNNDWYNPGRGVMHRIVWYFCNLLLFQSYLFPFSKVKSSILRIFGAEIGRNCIWKPGINIKYPWNLKIGNNCWIGEGVWIDNLGLIEIGNDVCLSQGSYLLCGNHNYKKKSFDLIVEAIQIKDGCWIGAKAIVCPGAMIQSHAILSVGSVAVGILKENGIYQGNPAEFKKERKIESKS